MFVALVVGYCLGSLPFGFWIAKAHGVCIFDVGSGNPGATNVLRTIGRKAGYAVFFLDALKGLLATFIGLKFQYPYVGLFGALIGHGFSCFMRFKGGKGVAALIGGLFLLIPLPLLAGLAVWLAVFKYTRYVSCASICFVFSLLPFCCLLEGIPSTRTHALPLLVLCICVLVHHRANLVRLWGGEENRF